MDLVLVHKSLKPNRCAEQWQVHQLLFAQFPKWKVFFLQKNDIISHFDGLKIRQEATNFEEEKSTSTKSGGKVIDR